jgi:hypothetical protein
MRDYDGSAFNCHREKLSRRPGSANAEPGAAPSGRSFSLPHLPVFATAFGRFAEVATRRRMARLFFAL